MGKIRFAFIPTRDGTGATVVIGRTAEEFERRMASTLDFLKRPRTDALEGHQTDNESAVFVPMRTT